MTTTYLRVQLCIMFLLDSLSLRFGLLSATTTTTTTTTTT